MSLCLYCRQPIPAKHSPAEFHPDTDCRARWEAANAAREASGGTYRRLSAAVGQCSVCNRRGCVGCEREAVR